MPAPTNISFATATDLGTLPATVSQQVDDAGTTYTVYYSFTAPANCVEMGAFAFGDLVTYQPTCQPFSGPVGAPVQILSISGENVPIQFPVTAGSQYFLKIIPNGGNPTPANLSLNVQAAANSVAPAGSVMVNDDTPGFPLAALSASTGLPLRFVPDFPAGEGAAILADGTLCVQNLDLGGVSLYSSSLELIADVVVTENRQISCTLAASRTFYIANRGAGLTHTTVRTISPTGTLGGTTWTLPAAGCVGLAPSPDETILYVVGQSSDVGTPVKRWDLVNSVMLSDLVAGVANYQFMQDLIVLNDGSVLVGYVRNGTPWDSNVVCYSSAGATLHTYSLGSTDAGVSDNLDRICTAVDHPNSFWVWSHLATGFSRFRNIRVSDGSVLTDVSAPEFESGVYNPTASATPAARFGHSFSCPIWVSRAPLGPTTTTTTYPIRRVRQSPHFSTDQLWQFFANFQLDIEAGVGLTTGQGSDPVAMLSWSDDGGHTWSNERWLHFGKIGEYTKRAMLRGSVGRSRDRIWKVVISDPVPVRILQALVQAEKGLS